MRIQGYNEDYVGNIEKKLKKELDNIVHPRQQLKWRIHDFEWQVRWDYYEKKKDRETFQHYQKYESPERWWCLGGKKKKS